MTSLKCRIHDVVVPAEYAAFGEDVYIVCAIPSFPYLEAKTETGLPADLALVVEVSLDDGYSFSSSGLTFKFLLNDQLGAPD